MTCRFLCIEPLAFWLQKGHAHLHVLMVLTGAGQWDARPVIGVTPCLLQEAVGTTRRRIVGVSLVIRTIWQQMCSSAVNPHSVTLASLCYGFSLRRGDVVQSYVCLGGCSNASSWYSSIFSLWIVWWRCSTARFGVRR